jgi:hypothetical protein
MDTYIPTQIHARLSRNKKKSRSRYRRTRNGQCAAAVRALTAARHYLDHKVPNLAAAALCCGSSVTYVQAALILIKSENETLLERVRRNQMPLQAAAAQIKQIANLVNAYRAASAADRVAFARTIGPTTLFDSALVPAI